MKTNSQYQSRSIRIGRGETVEITLRENGIEVLNEFRGPIHIAVYKKRKSNGRAGRK